ncbi:hypothetical protein [Streptomyces morookaense]|uniref:FtsK domain-containing protein n=1 Tax=Streptomyces morookaense TaxID=1970 RepID=A0A7Y7E928_STRMO|nr:hypothetical protein [Streptomyces morookaense]NVK79967.1 hypothetical protein [Streptomyces morookaense]GHF50741.1 membrane protein [Streptomyces morookaense]
MGRRGLPRTVHRSPRLPQGREFAQTVAESARDVFHPLIVITRGLQALAVSGRRRWAETPRERRGSAVLLAASCLAIVALVPYGPPLATVSLLAAGAWAGRARRTQRTQDPEPAEAARLQALYEALVPYLSDPQDPRPLYEHGGSWRKAFDEYVFDDRGRLAALQLRYPGWFTDGENASRARIEQLLRLKAGRDREYGFDWDESANRLCLTVLPPLPTDVRAQRFVTAPGETVLGFTDPEAVQRTLPVADGDELHDASPVVWRTGPRSAEPHLLALGRPGAGVTTLLRSVLLQALPHGDAVIVDGGGTGEYAALAGRHGVLAVESSLTGALAVLEWAGHETERRLMAVNSARQQGHPVPEDARRPLWIVVDRPVALSRLAAAQGRPDPQMLLQVPLFNGRVANVTVAIGEQLDAEGLLDAQVRTQALARVLLGGVTSEQVLAALGTPARSTTVDDVPPGRGYARLGSGPVHRLQVPATPDPYDEDAGEAQRQAVLDLLPEAVFPTVPTTPAYPAADQAT